jgi:hypothetical protein
LNKIIDNEEIELITNASLLTKEQSNIINEIIKHFDTLTDKNNKKIKNYLTRLIIKNKPFKVNQFLERNNLGNLPDKILTLLNQL